MDLFGAWQTSTVMRLVTNGLPRGQIDRLNCGFTGGDGGVELLNDRNELPKYGLFIQWEFFVN